MRQRHNFGWKDGINSVDQLYHMMTKSNKKSVYSRKMLNNNGEAMNLPVVKFRHYTMLTLHVVCEIIHSLRTAGQLNTTWLKCVKGCWGGGSFSSRSSASVMRSRWYPMLMLAILALSCLNCLLLFKVSGKQQSHGKLNSKTFL